MSNRRKRIFISVANREHADLRVTLRDLLTRAGFDVVVQPDFPQTVSDTVRKLDELIAPCDLVVHVVGRNPGSLANPIAVNDFFAQTDQTAFLAHLPGTQARLGDCATLTYAQWEPWLALHRKIGVLVYGVAGHDAADFPQRSHLDALVLARRYAETFTGDAAGCGLVVADVFAHFGLVPGDRMNIRTFGAIVATLVVFMAIGVGACGHWVNPPPPPRIPPLALYWTGFVQQVREGRWEAHPLTPGAELRDGDQFRLVVSTTADCYLCVVNVDSSENVSVLRVGEEKSGAKRCLASQHYTIPDPGWFTVRGRPGPEVLYVVASYDPLDELASRLGGEVSPHGRPPLADEIGRLRAAPEGEVRTRGGKVVTRGVVIEQDRREATTALRDGTSTSAIMEQVAGLLHVVKEIPFQHR